MTPSNQTTRFLGSLRAVRRFSDRAIADDVLRDILEAGRRTGSSKNTQPWQIVVVRDREMLKRLSELGGFAGYIAAAQVDIVLVSPTRTRARRRSFSAFPTGAGSGRPSRSAIPPTRKRLACPAHQEWALSCRSAVSRWASSSAGSITASALRAGAARYRSRTPVARAPRPAIGPGRARCSPRPSAAASGSAGAT
ncbi:MAG: hypothetical protein E6J35_04750 [Chloroflexi bacterium]|nr:MAG: hypothetical protein E6J35_04750 [Chloroflexota bacterium]